MAFTIVFLIGVAIWLCYEYFTDASYHAKKADARKIERRYKDWNAARKKLIEDGWTILDPREYEQRERDILSKLEKDDRETLKRTELYCPPLVSSTIIGKQESDNQIFRLGYLMNRIHKIELRIIDYHEKVISSDDVASGNFPNYDRDLRFYNWLKDSYDLYLMPHKDLICRAKRVLSADDLVYRTDVVRDIVGDLPDPEYGKYYIHLVNYHSLLPEEKDTNGRWHITAKEAIEAPYSYYDLSSYRYGLSDFLGNTNRIYESEISEEELSLNYEPFSHNAYAVLCYDKEILRGDIEPSHVEEDIIQMLLPGFNDKRFFTGLSPVKTNLRTLPEWKLSHQFDSLEEALSFINSSADSYWEKDKETGEFALIVKAYAIFRKYGKVGSDEVITRKVCVIAKDAKSYYTLLKYHVLCYDKLIFTGSTKASYKDDNTVMQSLLVVSDKNIYDTFSVDIIDTLGASDWNLICYTQDEKKAISFKDHAFSRWEKNEATGVYALHVKAYAALREYQDDTTGEKFIRILYVSAKGAGTKQ